MKKITVKIIGWILVALLFMLCLLQNNFAFLTNLFSGAINLNNLIENLVKLGALFALSLCLTCSLHSIAIAMPAFIIPFLASSCFGFLNGVVVCVIGFIIGNCIVYLINRKFRFESMITSIANGKLSKCKNSKILLLTAIINPGIPYREVVYFLTSKKFLSFLGFTTLLVLPQVLIYALIAQLLLLFSPLVWLIGLAVLIVLAIVFRVLRSRFVSVYEKTVRDKAVEHKTDTVVKKQNPILYSIILFGLKIFVKLKTRFSAKLETEIEGPAIVLCSHGSFTDFLYCAMLLNKHHPYFVVARLYFYNSKLAWLIKNLGCFPKSMFSTDIENLKNCMRILQNGGVLTMMPEARLSTVGKFEGIQPTTYKFIKKMGVNVYGMKIDGSFLSNPKWGDGIRAKSVVNARLTLIASKEDIAEISEEELKNAINETIRYDDFEWIKNHPEITYNSKTLAEGLENVLFVCPHCKKQFTIKTKGRAVYCEHCGFKRELGDNYYFTEQTPFKHFGEWYEYQREVVNSEVLQNENYSYSDRVILKHQSYDGETLLRVAGEGVCTLNKDGLTYVGSQDGEQVEKHFKLSVVYRILFGAGENFEVYDGKQIYYFVPPDTRSCVKWYILSGILNTEE